MNRPIAAVDSDILIWLLDTTSSADARRKRAYVELTMERLNRLQVRWIVRAPVIAELYRGGPGLLRLRDVALRYLKAVRVEALDARAADLAGQISAQTLRARRGRERGAVKFDALIAAIAHHVGARWLLTANVDDMRSHLKVIGSGIEVVNATEPPASGQQELVEVLKPGASPPVAAPNDGAAASAPDVSRPTATPTAPPAPAAPPATGNEADEQPTRSSPRKTVIE